MQLLENHKDFFSCFSFQKQKSVWLASADVSGLFWICLRNTTLNTLQSYRSMFLCRIGQKACNQLDLFIPDLWQVTELMLKNRRKERERELEAVCGRCFRVLLRWCSLVCTEYWVLAQIVEKTCACPSKGHASWPVWPPPLPSPGCCRSGWPWLCLHSQSEFLQSLDLCGFSQHKFFICVLFTDTSLVWASMNTAMNWWLCREVLNKKPINDIVWDFCFNCLFYRLIWDAKIRTF